MSYSAPTKRRNSTIRPRRIKFWEEFASELDLLSSPADYPDWIFNYRDELIAKTSPELKKICRRLKDYGLDFKIKWPIVIDGKWKFADVYFPRQNTVLILGNPMSNMRPCGQLSYRAEFFKDRYRVVEVESLAELERKVETKQRENEEN